MAGGMAVDGKIGILVADGPGDAGGLAAPVFSAVSAMQAEIPGVDFDIVECGGADEVLATAETMGARLKLVFTELLYAGEGALLIHALREKCSGAVRVVVVCTSMRSLDATRLVYPFVDKLYSRRCFTPAAAEEEVRIALGPERFL